MNIDRSDLKRADRAALERLARFLKLHVDPAWSKKHVVELIRWRLTRLGGRNRH